MFLDFAIAIFITLIFDATFNTGVFPLLYWSLLFSILIDLDFITHKLFKKHVERGYKHRDLLHYPLVVLPVGFFGIYYFSETLAYAFLVIMFLHFLHDSIAYGRGIKWLFPFSKNSYAFFYLYSRTKHEGLWQWVFVFNESNLDAWDNEHADEDWIQNIYFKLHPIAIVENGTFILSLICLYLYLYY